MHIKLLEIQVLHNRIRPGASDTGTLRIEELCPIRSIVVEACVEANEDLRSNDGIVDVSDHAARNARTGLGGFARLIRLGFLLQRYVRNRLRYGPGLLSNNGQREEHQEDRSTHC